MKRKFFVLAAMVFILSSSLNAQDKFMEFVAKDGVELYYKWQNEKKSKADSPLELVIKIKNTNAYKTNVGFTVDYFYKTLRKASSDPQSFCVKSKKAIFGKVKKPEFDKAGLSNEQLLSDDFILELSEVTVTKSPDCKQKK